MKRDIFSDAGFTLVELLFVIVIISILCGISLSAFYVYRQDAEYTKAEHMLRNAETAIMLGNMDTAKGFSSGYETTGTGGGPMPANMSFLPGAVTPINVRLGASITDCAGSTSPVRVNLLLVGQPCKADRQVRWVQFCSGDELMQTDIAWAPDC